MKIGIVYTVKNEERLLRKNILYHKAIGIDYFFVYLDNPTDNTEDSIKDLEYVDVQKSISSEKYKSFSYLEKFTSQAKEHHTARQCLNTFDAKQKCLDKKINWLISIDADELFNPNIDENENGSTFFNKIPENIDVVNFKVYEALQRKVAYDNVFAEETLFKSRHVFKSRFEKLFKYIYNPFNKKYVKFPYWYGQHLGKAAIRVDSKIIPHNVHRYKNYDEGKLQLIDKGSLLHYHFYDAKDFIKKFENFKEHPNTFLSGNKVGSLKLLLRDVVNKSGMNEVALNDYFVNYLMFSEREVKKLLRDKLFFIFQRKEKSLQRINRVKKVIVKHKIGI
ncbi:MAG: hypothetical protein COB12_11150 [Flavobacterium sp.]|nr:MAG: hypothetical protein COB12_11150 [Flavobacterium sp.]